MFKKVAVAAIAALLALVVAACGSSTPQKWDGSWKADGFTAQVQNKTIEVHITGNDTDALFWKGTFAPSSDTLKEETVSSSADTTANKASIFGSQDATKAFQYEDGALKFTIQMMGVKREVSLTKSSS